MGALKLAYYETKSPLKIAYRREEKEGGKVVQGFLRNDPLADKLPQISPYSYALDNPIKFVDPDGKFPFPVTVRAFAPTGAFRGSGFNDDKRGFSAARNASARISQTTTIDPAKWTVTGGTPTSSDTRWNGIFAGNATNLTDKGGVDKISSSTNDGSGKVSIDEHFTGSNPTFLGTAPDIEVNSSVTLTENDKEGYLDAAIDLSSKQFPATEAIIGDASGQTVFLTGAAAYGNAGDLIKGKSENAASASIRITIDKKGNFTGIVSGGKTYSVSAWNKAQTAKPAGPFSREKKDSKNENQ